MISKIKILTEWVNSKVEITVEGVSKLEDKSIQIIQSEQQRENRLKKNEHSLMGLWENNKRSNTHATEDLKK